MELDIKLIYMFMDEVINLNQNININSHTPNTKNKLGLSCAKLRTSFGPKKFGLKKSLVKKKVWSKKKFGPKKSLGR